MIRSGWIYDLWAVFLREIRSVSQNRNIIAASFLAPFFFAFFYGSIYSHKSEVDVPIVVVDHDRSSLSRLLTRNLDGHQAIAVRETVTDIDVAEARLHSLAAQAVVYIPADFQASLQRGQGADLIVNVNASRFLIANDINKAISMVAATMGAAVRLKYFQAQGYAYEQARELVQPLRGDVRALFNPADSYGDFILPGMMVIILQTTLLIGLSESVAREREKKQLGELFGRANGMIWAALGGKGLFYFLLYGIYSLFFFGVIFSIFKLPLVGSALALAVVTIVFLTTVIMLCLFVASFFASELIAFQVIIFTTYPVFLLSGYSWPLPSMPVLLKPLAWAIPSTPYITAVSRITLMGGEWQVVWIPLLHLALLTTLYATVTSIRWRRLFATGH